MTQVTEAREVITQALLGVSYTQALAEWEGGELEGTVSGDAFGSLVALFVRLRELEQERDVWIAREQEVRDGSLADAWRASAFKEHAKRIQVEQERDEAGDSARAVIKDALLLKEQAEERVKQLEAELTRENVWIA